MSYECRVVLSDEWIPLHGNRQSTSECVLRNKSDSDSDSIRTGFRELSGHFFGAVGTVSEMGRNGTVGVEWRVRSVPDNPKTAIIHACRLEPVLHRSYQKMAAHCGTVILPVPAAGRSPGYHPWASPHSPDASVC